jgi:Prokaryotic cytochrome b561
MSQSKPYQPSLLRLLHGINGVIVIGALISGFWVYNVFDGRWGKLPLPRVNSIIDIHGTIGLTFLLFTPLFFLYSLLIGYKRLIQKNSLAKLAEVGTPIGWYSLQRLINTMMLIASLFALGTGKLMLESWLPAGELFHVEYLLHLTAWAVMLVCLVLHLLMSARVGGVPLLLSMVSLKLRENDRPSLWLEKIRTRRE